MMVRFLNRLILAATLSISSAALPAHAQPVNKNKAANTTDKAHQAPSTVNAAEVGYAASRGIVSYGGKTFAIWLAGSNPASATIFLVALAGGQLAGRGFDAVTQYLHDRNITPPPPPTQEELEAMMNEMADDFVLVEEEPIIQLEEDAHGDLIPVDADGNPIEIEVYTDDVEQASPTYTERLYALGNYGAQQAYTAATNLINGLPRMGTATLTGALAGMVAQAIGGDILAAMVNPAANNAAGQVFDNLNVVMLEEAPEMEETQPEDNDTTPFTITYEDPNPNILIEDYIHPANRGIQLPTTLEEILAMELRSNILAGNIYYSF